MAEGFDDNFDPMADTNPLNSRSRLNVQDKSSTHKQDTRADMKKEMLEFWKTLPEDLKLEVMNHELGSDAPNLSAASAFRTPRMQSLSPTPSNPFITRSRASISSAPPTASTRLPTRALPTQPPSVLATQPPSVLATQPPSVFATQPPSVLTTQPPPVFATQPPSVFSTHPSSVVPVQPPLAPIVLPNFHDMDNFSNGPGESWDSFIERWEIKIRPYRFSSEQLALTLPDRFTGAAYAKYKRVVRANPSLMIDYVQLRAELNKLFTVHTNLQGRGLYSIQQGRRTVGEYYAELSSLADTAYGNVPEAYRDTFVVDIFIQGLRESIKKGLMFKGKMTLSQALHEAEVVELAELQNKTPAKIMSVNEVNSVEPLLAPLCNQIKDLKLLVEKQAGNPVAQRNHQPQPPYRSSYGSNHRRPQDNNKPRQFSNNFQPRPRTQSYNSQSQSQSFRNISNRGRSQRPSYGRPQQPQSADRLRSKNNQSNNGCWTCGSRNHWSRECPKKNVNAVTATADGLEPQQYAEFLLTQPQEMDDLKVNAVEVVSNPPLRKPPSRGTGSKLSPKNSFMLTLLTVCALFSGTESARIILPDNPMICGSTPKAAHIYNITHEYPCTSNATSNNHTVPQNMNIQVYQKNIVEWQSEAYQCAKFKDKIATQISFFTDIKSRTATTERIPVSREECERMITHKTCSAGSLIGSNGVYVTQNSANASYQYCCKEHTFEADQCSVIVTSVFKKHNVEVFESPAGDVSHCRYEHGSCLLSDQSILVWETNKESYCEYEKWYTIKGKLYEDHFVSNDRNLALTFHTYGFLSFINCKGNKTSLSDQGVMISFLDTVNFTTLAQKIKADYTAWGDDVVLLNAMLQGLAGEMHNNLIEQFWNSYYYTCHLLSQTLKIITLLMEKHPTVSARYMLQNPYIIASSGPGILEIYPCTELPPDLYRILPMSENNCTQFIPIEVSMGGSKRIGYLDPIENVVHKDTHTVDCSYIDRVILRLNGSTLRYSRTGDFSALTNVSRLRLPDIQLGIQPIKIHETVYSTAHRLNWHELSNHQSLNTLLATLDRQRQVLEAMGVQSSPHHTLEHNVIESKESLLGNSLFAFLFGGHVASGYELWSFFCNIIVSIVAIGFILYTLRKHCCPNF